MFNELPVNCGCGGKAIVHEQEYGEFEVYCPNCGGRLQWPALK